MARIGNQPIIIPPTITLTLSKDNIVTVKNPKNTALQLVHPDVTVNIEDNTLTLTIPTQQKRHKALQGLYRALIYNMIEGLTKGFSKTLKIKGIGYKVNAPKPNVLEFHLGYSHPIYFILPNEIESKIENKDKNPTIVLKSHDKQLLGEVAMKIRAFRKHEPYKGKGIRVDNEYVRRKQGKTANT